MLLFCFFVCGRIFSDGSSRWLPYSSVNTHTHWAKSFGYIELKFQGAANITPGLLFFCFFSRSCWFLFISRWPSDEIDVAKTTKPKQLHHWTTQCGLLIISILYAPVCQPDGRPLSIPHDKHFQSLKRIKRKKRKKERSFLLSFLL